MAARAGCGRLVLSHFSQRYEDPALFAREAGSFFDGEIVVARDLDRVPVPPRRTSTDPIGSGRTSTGPIGADPVSAGPTGAGPSECGSDRRGPDRCGLSPGCC